mgnify:CR=1 FL=1
MKNYIEMLGNVYKRPSINKNTGKWAYLDIDYPSQDEFNEATGKIMSTLYAENASGKCIVNDNKGVKYILDIVHATFDTTNNIIRVLPYDCRQMMDINDRSNDKLKKNEGK